MIGRYPDIWQEIEKSSVVQEIQEKKVRLKPELIFNDYMTRIEDRARMEEQVR